MDQEGKATETASRAAHVVTQIDRRFTDFHRGMEDLVCELSRKIRMWRVFEPHDELWFDAENPAVEFQGRFAFSVEEQIGLNVHPQAHLTPLLNLTSLQKFYSEDDAEQILRAAIMQSDDTSVVSGNVSRDRLQQMAAEAGISPEALARAEREIVATRDEQRWREEFRRKQRSRAMAHISSFFGTNLFMIAIWFLAGGGYFWPIWLLIFWGLGVVKDVVSAMFPQSQGYRDGLSRYMAEQSAVRANSANAEQFLIDYFAVADPNDKIGAIKHVREQMGLSLRDAKNVVDAFFVRRICDNQNLLSGFAVRLFVCR